MRMSVSFYIKYASHTCSRVHACTHTHTHTYTHTNKRTKTVPTSAISADKSPGSGLASCMHPPCVFCMLTKIPSQTLPVLLFAWGTSRGGDSWQAWIFIVRGHCVTVMHVSERWKFIPKPETPEKQIGASEKSCLCGGMISSTLCHLPVQSPDPHTVAGPWLPVQSPVLMQNCWPLTSSPLTHTELLALWFQYSPLTHTHRVAGPWLPVQSPDSHRIAGPLFPVQSPDPHASSCWPLTTTSTVPWLT